MRYLLAIILLSSTLFFSCSQESKTPAPEAAAPKNSVYILR
jgi:hypothetical protein